MIIKTGAVTALSEAKKRLDGLFRGKATDRYVLCLAHITAPDTGAPEFGLDELNHVAHLLPALPGEFRWRAIDVLRAAAYAGDSSVAAEIFQRVDPHVDKFAHHRDEDTQTAVLRLFAELLPKLPPDLVDGAVRRVVSSSRDAVRNARLVALDCLAWLFDNTKTDSHAQVRSLLLSALADDDEAVRTAARAFWAKVQRLGDDPVEFISAVLSPDQLFLPDAEHAWLGAVTSLLSQLSSRSVDFRKAFLQPLDERVQFQDLDLRGASVSGVSGSDAMEVESQAEGPMLRATMTPAFSMTLSQDLHNPSLSFAFSSSSLAAGEVSGAEEPLSIGRPCYLSFNNFYAHGV